MKNFITLLILLLSTCSIYAQDEDTTELDKLFVELDSLLPSDTFSVSETYVETTPQFPGGQVAFYKYLLKNLNYPIAARTAGIEGKVIVSFEILTDELLTKTQ
ncbi:energy transducer TonB [Marinoscillum furvescens]|nr:hypothetical protein [Marinoscillum furvescens]